MNPEINEKLGQLIKQITETGEWTLDENKLKIIKSTCKKSNHYVLVTFENVMAQLCKKHAQIRYSSLQLIEQLFERSKSFRELLTEDFPVFIQLVVGIQSEKLPPPQPIAAKLKQYALALIKNWYIKYGEKYRQLGVSFDFLLDNGLINDNQSGSSLSSIHADNIAKANKSARIEAIHSSRYELLKADIDDHFEIINENLNTMEGCFDILVPKNTMREESDIDFEALLRGESTPKKSTESDYRQDIASHGLGSNRYKITIDLSEASLMDDVKETKDNSVIFDQLREAFTVMETKHVKDVNNWINSLIRIDIKEKAEKETRIKSLIDLKSRITETSRKAQLLGVQVLQPKTGTTEDGVQEEGDNEFEDEEFEEVDINKEVKLNKKQNNTKTPPLQRIFPLSHDPHMTEDPTYTTFRQASNIKATTKDKGKQKTDTAREELLKSAPVVEWGDDLYYWDKEHIQFNTSGIERSHRFMGVGEGANEMPDHLLDDLRKRPVYYRSQTQKEIPACKYPLHNGGLCPRRDLVTCPFHGKIVPRDELGRPLDSSSAPVNNQNSSLDALNNKNEQVMDNLWELLEDDVMNQTGQERIILNKRRQKKRPTENSLLIDIKRKPENSYTRLQRKMNSAKSKRLAEEAADYEREMKSRNREASRWQ